MNNKTIPLDYANDLVYELQKAFWDERGKGARFRTTTVGRGYYAAKVRPLLKDPDLETILQTISDVLKSEGIVGQVSYSSEERLLRISVAGCVHRPVEDKMMALGVEPFTCMPANLIVLAIEEKLDRPAELAEIKVEDGACHLMLVVFDQWPTYD